MPQSFASMYVHIVFSTKQRTASMTKEIASRLYEYIGGIVRNAKCTLVIAGGTPDHIHLLCDLDRSVSVADLVRIVKSNSSRWMHESFENQRHFAWQNGYGAFSVSQSNIESVKKYIMNQEEHHRTFSFQDELRSLLKKHNLDFDERYLWD